MALAKDHSDLPRSRPGEGLMPDAEPRFIGVLVEAWAEANDDDKATAHGTPFRHSDAGKCARAISYAAAEIPKSDPMDLTGIWNVTLGSRVHDFWQEALQARFPDAEIEVKVRTVGADGSGHIDAVIRDGGRVIAYELKTVGGYAYKEAVGAQSKGKPATGPKDGHLLQAALNGRAIDADEVVIGWLAKECISQNVAARFGLKDDLVRFAAEWTLTREQYEPLADQEAARIAGILDLVKSGELAARKIPGETPPGAEITDPLTGVWVLREPTYDDNTDYQITDTGSYWGCAYCSYQTTCALTEPGRIPIDSVKRKEAAA